MAPQLQTESHSLDPAADGRPTPENPGRGRRGCGAAARGPWAPRTRAAAATRPRCAAGPVGGREARWPATRVGVCALDARPGRIVHGRRDAPRVVRRLTRGGEAKRRRRCGRRPAAGRARALHTARSRDRNDECARYVSGIGGWAARWLSATAHSVPWPVSCRLVACPRADLMACYPAGAVIVSLRTTGRMHLLTLVERVAPLYCGHPLCLSF